MDDRLINWVKDGEYRIRTLKLLQSHPLLPSEIASILGVHRVSISRVLRDLRSKALVERIESGSRTKTQRLTPLGKELVKQLLEARL